MSSQVKINYIANPGGNLQGEVHIPGDKSISHRSIMLGSLANGTTNISGFLQGKDALATLNAFRAMGVSIEGPDPEGNVIIQGEFLQQYENWLNQGIKREEKTSPVCGRCSRQTYW